MSNGYGIDLYGTVFYGYSQPVDYSVAPFTATQTDYERITLNWVSPNSTPWKDLRLVRSTYGYPSTPVDGTTVLTIVPESIRSTFEDTGLLPGRIYYYTMFISVEAPTYNAGTSYLLNTVVLFDNQYWKSIQGSNTGNTPAVGSAFWLSVPYTPVWSPAGYAASLAVSAYGYGELLYNRVPQPYKVSNSDVFSDASTDNVPLQQYLNVFGWGLDITRTNYDSYLQLNNPDIVSASNLDILGKQLGSSTNYLASPQSRRQTVKNLSVNYRLKGTDISIHNAVAAITGWDSDITQSANLMIGSDSSRFTSPVFDMWNASTSYQVGAVIQFNGYLYKCLVQALGTAQEPSGTTAANTWWAVQQSTTAAPLLDTARTLANPVSNFTTGTGIGGFSSWSTEYTVDSTNPQTVQTGVYIGLPNPLNPNDHTTNALGYHSTVSPSTSRISNISINVPFAPAWTNATNYVVNNWVTTPTSLYWKAIKPSGPGTPYGFITPGTNATYWQQQAKPIVSVSDPINFMSDAVPVQKRLQWDSSITYNMGEEVEFFGIYYLASRTSTNSPPTGYYYSSEDWIYVQPAEYAYTSSAQTARLTTNTTAFNPYYDLSFLYNKDDSGALLLTAQDTFYVMGKFEDDYLDLNGAANLTAPFNPGYVWNSTPSTANLWFSSYGMAAVSQTLAGTTTYVYTILNPTQPDLSTNFQIGITFVTDYVDTVHKGHGVMFNMKDGNNFMYATRKSLYNVVAGVETLLTSWPRLSDGDRMIVSYVGNSIDVLAYVRDGSGELNSIATATATRVSGGINFGMIQKYSASGAV